MRATASSGTTPPLEHGTSLSLRRVAALAALVAAAVHIPVTPHHLDEAPYMGVLFIAFVIACVLLAVGLLLTESTAVHLVAAVLCALAIATYVLTRAAALPMLAHDVGDWLEPLGLAAIYSESVVVGSYLALIRRGSGRQPGGPRSWVRCRGRGLIGSVVTVGLFALVLAMLVSEEGDDHPTAAGGGGEGHLHSHGSHQHANPGATTTEEPQRLDLATQLAAAQAAASQFPTVSDALADGWTLAEDYAAQVGAHFMRYDEIDSVFDVARPEMLLYGGDALNSPIVGLAYYVVDREPEGFAGDADVWHQHLNVCIGPDGPLWGADGIGICATNTSAPVGNWAWMLHAWVIPEWASPQGVFSTANLALP